MAIPQRSAVPALFVLLLTVLGPGALAQDAPVWRDLFDGATLDGWEQHGSTAEYAVVGGEIVGTTVETRTNTFLCTEETFGDFIFECEMLLPSTMNSGVMFRANVREPDDRVYGYQCEVDPSARAWSGGIYDEARRRWLYPLTYNEPARDYFRVGAWNTLRIEALGEELRTYVNGKLTSRLVDAETARGIFGLQVHGVYKPEDVGLQVRWRKLRVLTEDVATHRLTPDETVREVSFLDNRLTDYERARGWRLLWDGETTAGWRGAKLDGFPERGWTIADGVLTVEATDGGESTGPGDIVTERHYGDFELEFQFKLSEGANSGVKYFVDPSLNQGAGSAIGCEFQLLDDERHPDAKLGVRGNRTIGSLYDLIPAHNVDYGRTKQVNAPGQWNHGRIVSRGGLVQHYLNGEKVVEYDRHSQAFAALVNYSKYRDWENFGRWPAGAILLQDHGDEVSFRSIKIREL